MISSFLQGPGFTRREIALLDTDPNVLIPIPDHFRSMADLKVEHSRVAFYRADNLIAVETVGVGDESSVVTDPLELEMYLRRYQPRAIVHAHNHPNIGVGPGQHPDSEIADTVSLADIQFQQWIANAAAEHNAQLRDTLVIGKNIALSLKRAVQVLNEAWIPAPTFSPFDFDPF